MKVQNAVKHLNELLPLKEKQMALDEKTRSIHRGIYRSFVEKGRPLNKKEISAMLGGADPDAALTRLSNDDLVVVDEDTLEPTGAYPMTIEDTDHVVKVNGQTIHAMCALDAMSISPMFGYEVEINSCCYVTGEPVYLKQNKLNILEVKPSRNIHFGIIWGDTCGCCAHSLCTEMVFLKDQATADKWQKEQPDAREIFTLDEALQFSVGFFLPLVQD